MVTIQEMVEQACSERLTEMLKDYAIGKRMRGRLPDGTWYDIRLTDLEVTVASLNVELELTEEQR